MHTREKKKRRGSRTLPLLVAGLGILLSGCDFEVLNPGQILDDDLNDPNLVDVLVAGVSGEFNDLPDTYAFTIARLTDEVAGSGSYFATGQYRRGVFDDEDSGFWYDNAHEIWFSVDNTWERLQEVLENPQGRHSARLFMLEGFAHRYLGETFCEVTYNESPLQPRTAAFDSAIATFQTAVSHASGVAEAADFETASYAGMAQAYVGLGDWSSAVAEAAKVPTDFEFLARYHQQANQNQVFDETHDRPEISAIATLAASFEPDQDPRAPYTKCGEYADPNDPSQGVVDTGAGCQAQQGADGLTPHWRQEKYDENGSDVPIAKGTEMRLIEAEAALRDGDLGTFTGKVNEVRDFYGLDPIEEPAEAGELEYPNAMDDGWSILDAERWLTLWIEGRRLWDLHRWDHPFLNGGSVIYPGEARRASCMPIPDDECLQNENLHGVALLTSTGGTQMCG